jgi:ATP-dependent DNA ligase
MLPGVFQPTLFSGWSPVRASNFLRPIHPKTEIRPTRAAIQKILEAGWLAQLKIHGHRSQIHIPEDPQTEILIFNRQGQVHKKQLSDSLISELRRFFTPQTDWNVIDAEWIKNEEKIFVFDFLKLDGKLLNRLNFINRWKLLPRSYISPTLRTLGVLTKIEECLEVFEHSEVFIEGLVFRSSSPGFEDSSIIRCRR